jgi:succinate-acetate transporter protein
MSTTTIRMPESTIPDTSVPETAPLVIHTDSPIADPGPLGVAAFAMTTFVLSIFNAGLVGNPKLEAVVLPLALVYGGFVQLLAGMWEFKKNNTFGALAFSSFGAFWISFFVYVQFIAPTLPPADAHTATGIFLLSWTIFTAYMLLASVKTNAVLTAVFGALTITFALLTLGAFNLNVSLTHAGGYFGLITAGLAWYLSAAVVTNATWGRKVLPTFPARKA